jgi:hypothetical protein
MSKIFDRRNITVPMRAASKVVLGTDFRRAKPLDP